MSEKSKAGKAKPNEIQITRVYDAPVAAVWDAWTDPKQVAKWWGPRGFTLTTHSKELKPGGHWRYTMHGPDGTDFPNVTHYYEVEKQKRLVYDHGATDETPPLFRVTVQFVDLGKKTRMEMVMTLATADAAAETRKFIKKAGGDSTWDRLAEQLAHDSKSREIFVINRSFDAPIEKLFQMWRDPKHLAKWMPPTGFTMEYIRAGVEKGKSSFYQMTGANGASMYGRSEYLEITSPRRIVYMQQFCDENEKVTRHPMAPHWPETVLTTVTLEEEGSDRTRVTIEWEPYGKVTREELETFIQARAGMTQGWTGSLDKLEAYLL